MNEKQIMEGNKLIAEFMNFEYVESDGFWLDDGSMLVDLAHRMNNGIEFQELLFHESWDWLMPVIKKIFTKKGVGYKLTEDLIYWLTDVNLNECYYAVTRCIEDINK